VVELVQSPQSMLCIIKGKSYAKPISTPPYHDELYMASTKSLEPRVVSSRYL